MCWFHLIHVFIHCCHIIIVLVKVCILGSRCLQSGGFWNAHELPWVILFILWLRCLLPAKGEVVLHPTPFPWGMAKGVLRTYTLFTPAPLKGTGVLLLWLRLSFYLCFSDAIVELHAMDENLFNDFLIGKLKWISFKIIFCSWFISCICDDGIYHINLKRLA